MARPTLLFLLILTAATALAQAQDPDDDAKSPRPNVLFLAIDDLNDWVGFLGGYPGVVHTPNLDRLAAMGTAFTNAHTAAPVCCPSRASALSGLLPTTTGIYNNQHWWKPNLPDLLTLPVHFRANGYHTIGSGKIFHHTAGNNPPNQWDAFQRLLFNDNAWIRTAPLYPWTTTTKTPEGFPFAGIVNYSGEADWGVPPIKEKFYDDVVTANYAIDFLTNLPAPQRGKLPPITNHPITNNPFFLACGIFHPHMPWYIPQKYLDLYPLDQVHVPEDKPDDLDDIPAPGVKLALKKADNLQAIRDKGLWPTAVRHYLASITFADTQVGRVLDALAKSPAAKNTIIVLWSDHGWHLGEKGHWHKRTLWEEATRVPLIIAAPNAGKPDQRCAQPVSLVDMFPTLVELCGLPPVKNLDGLSLVPLLHDPGRKRERPAIIVHESGHLAIRSEHHRYIRYKNGENELYDHRNDPNEWTNLLAHHSREGDDGAGNPNHAQTIANLAKWLPKNPANPALTKKSFTFDPDTFTFTNKKTGQIIKGQ